MFVDGVPRVVCGVTEETTCQEVVLALAQALGQPGRYTLRETFKDFDRCMMPEQRLVETLEKYGEQAREVQLTLLHSGSSVWDEMSQAKVGRYQPCPPMRRKDAGARIRRGSSSLSLHRQSLPVLSCLKQEADQKQEDLKRPKRKSLTLMEEAWEWLESLGRGKVYSTASDKESKKKNDKRNRTSLDLSLSIEKYNSDRSSRGKARGQRNSKSDLDHQTSCCIANQTMDKELKLSKKTQEAKLDQRRSSCASSEDEKTNLRETIIRQLLCLQGLQVQITHMDRQIFELEEKLKAERAEQEAHGRMVEEEREQIQLWENELKAEEGYEKVLQCQFLEMRAKAAECKAELEEYGRSMQALDLFSGLNVVQEDSEMAQSMNENAAEIPTAHDVQPSDLDGDKKVKKFASREDFNPPRALIPPNQIKERRPTGPTELREWWTRWSEAQNTQSQMKKKIHRSELTIYLGSAKI